MGLFARFNKGVTTEDVVEIIEETLREESVKNELWLMTTFIATVIVLRLTGGSRSDYLKGEHILNISDLDKANLYKEVFLAYLNAALLEPVLAIAGMQEVEGEELVINIFTLGSICWWIWLVTDAFDFSDVMQHYKFQVDIADEIAASDNPKQYSWLRLGNRDTESTRRSILGSLKKDVALWFMFSCIGAAWMPGIVSHRDVTHAYVVVFLWILLHHWCHKASSWSSGYFFSLMFPSTALMPMEYCLPLMDVSDCVEDLEFLVKYRAYIKDHTGVELIIES